MTIDASPTPPAGGAPPEFAPITSQADLDRTIADRLQRERAKFADYGDLKARAEKLDQIEAANATDLEKAVKTARTEGETAATAKATARIVRSEIKAAAAAAGFVDPADAVALFGDISGVRVTDDGDVDEAAIKARLKDISDAKKYLLGTAQVPDFDGGARLTPATRGGAGGTAEADRRFGKPAGAQ